MGPNWARVTAIISDNSNVSGMTLSHSGQSDCIRGFTADGRRMYYLSQLVDSQNMVKEGDKVVTSDISDKYLPNILIGYISKIDKDSDNLTKSGLIIPAVDS